MLIVLSIMQAMHEFELIEQALVEDNPHWSGSLTEQALRRTHNAQAINDLQLDEIQVVTGIRRCGKSTLLIFLIKYLIEHQIDARSILYLNLDDPNYTELCQDARHLYSVVTAAEKITGQTINYLLLDEIQNIPNWEQYIKTAYDRGRFKKILVTGSNADLLKSDYTNLLSGRYIETHLYPLNFQEVLAYNNLNDSVSLLKHKHHILRLVDDMMQFGGFPQIIQMETTDNKRHLLKNYYETLLLKDCIKNNHIRHTDLLSQLAHYLMTNISARYSYNSLSRALDSNENTIHEFLNIYHKAHLFHELKQFAFSLKTQNRSQKKIYCMDNGLINATTFRFSQNKGKLLENLVFTELLKRGHISIYYHNDQLGECDFIVHDTQQSTAIQVCYELNPDNRPREIKGLSQAMSTFNLKQGYIITYDQQQSLTDNQHIIPFWKWAGY